MNNKDYLSKGQASETCKTLRIYYYEYKHDKKYWDLGTKEHLGLLLALGTSFLSGEQNKNDKDRCLRKVVLNAPAWTWNCNHL